MAIPKTSLEQWAALAAVVDHEGFAQAAVAMNKSQSAVSYAVARLQESLDVPLLVIEGRKAMLTVHGRTLLQRARPLINDLETLERLARRLKDGWESELRLVVDAAFPRTPLLGIVRELQQLCPDTQIQLSDAVLSGAEEAIEDRQADVVVSSRVPQGFLGDLLTTVDFISVAHPDHPLFALGHAVGLNHLARHTQVVVRDSGRKRSRDEGWLGADRRCTVSSIEESRAMVKAGLGFAWLPEHFIADSLADGSLRPLPLEAGLIRTMPLYLVVVRHESAGPATRTAVECFQRHVPVSGGR